MRVWDILFNEGAKVLFHVALAIFKVFLQFSIYVQVLIGCLIALIFDRW